MSKLDLSVPSAEMIRDHNALLIAGLHKTIREIKQVPASERPAHILGQLEYCNHAIRALRWSTQIALQRAGCQTNAENNVAGAIIRRCF